MCWLVRGQGWPRVRARARRSTLSPLARSRRRACGRASIPPEITAAAAAELKAKAEKTKKAHADDKGQGGAPKEKEVPQGKGWGMPMKPVPRSIAVVHDNSR